MRSLSHIRAAIRLSGFLLLTFVCMPLYRFAPGRGMRRCVAGRWYLMANALAGLHVRQSGQVHRTGPVLYLANHASYLDIMVLGPSLDAVFVAKHDVTHWPLFGRIARMGECIFISRKVSHVVHEAQMIRAKLDAGRNVILFPEGTTGHAGKLLPFKSALLGALDGLPQVMVQPISIAYPDAARGGADDSLAWYGEMQMLPHLWSVLRRASSQAGVHFHPALPAGDFSGRKALAAACRAYVASGLGVLLAPHEPGDPEDKIGNYAWGKPSLR